ncbi:hypothetical protein GH714_010907 [Hevea brasiliensis]|uniref:MULE transposase domain-containing protein n=1 Tax=Hevea brasiliensis TaxID=3981 RepID=A0A6A6M9F0_HEVBR|nr:hypothetical protein GH714_010907 [Hevea brasiliensis]
MKDMMVDLNEKYALTVCKEVCYRAKKKALKILKGLHQEHCARLRSCLVELQRVDPIRNFKLDIKANKNSYVFSALYVGFSGLRKGFLVEARPVICMDVCFLTTMLTSALLSAIGRDGNDQMFPISWVVVEGENEATWSWFLKILFDDLGIKDGLGLTIISDQQKMPGERFVKFVSGGVAAGNATRSSKSGKNVSQSVL